MGCHFLLQGIFPTQGSNLGVPHCRQTLLPSEPPGLKVTLFFKKRFAYLVASSLSCSTQGLRCLLGNLSLQHMNTSWALWLSSCAVACGNLVPRPGIEPKSPALLSRFLTTGPPGKSLWVTLGGRLGWDLGGGRDAQDYWTQPEDE